MAWSCTTPGKPPANPTQSLLLTVKNFSRVTGHLEKRPLYSEKNLMRSISAEGGALQLLQAYHQHQMHSKRVRQTTEKPRTPKYNAAQRECQWSRNPRQVQCSTEGMRLEHTLADPKAPQWLWSLRRSTGHQLRL